LLPIRDHEPSDKTPFVTYFLIGLNVLVFLFEISSPNLDEFVARFSLIPALVNIRQLESWKGFITSQFLHGGFGHIISNMWFLWIFGDNVEARLGKIKYLLFYLLSGTFAGLSQFIFSSQSLVPMLGASGAVAGVLGAYWVLFPRHRIDTLVPAIFFYTRMTLAAHTVLLFWFVIQLFSGVGSLAMTASIGGIAYFAHVGGFLFGYYTAKRLPRSKTLTPTEIKF